MEKFVSWDVSYDVGVPSVDKQHRHLVDLINSLYNACLGERAELEATFRDVMKELVDYVMIHFKDEEAIMGTNTSRESRTSRERTFNTDFPRRCTGGYRSTSDAG